MCTSMKKNMRAFRRLIQIIAHTLEIETHSILIKVSILSHFKSTSFENSIVISPCWVTDINWSVQKLVKEITKNTKCTSSRYRLGRANSSTGNIFMIPSKKSTSSSSQEILVTCNGRIFLIKFTTSSFCLQNFLGFLNNRKNIRLTLVISICSLSKIDL